MATTKRTTAGTGNGSRTRSREITPRKAGLATKAITTINKVRSPRIYVPLLLAAGVGAAIMQRVFLTSRSQQTRKFLGNVASELQPRVSDAMRTLTAFGKELRAKVAR